MAKIDKKTLNYKLAVTGAFAALVILLGITRLGFISIPGLGISFTILQIPVIIATLMAGLVPGVAVGAIFGLFSLIQANLSAAGAMDALFRDPLISILPRMMIAVMTWLVDYLLRKIPRMPKLLSGGIAAFFGSLSNTVFVIGMLYLRYHSIMFTSMANKGYFAALGVLMPGALVEAVVSVIITVLVLGAFVVVKGKKSKVSKLEDSKAEDTDEKVPLK